LFPVRCKLLQAAATARLEKKEVCEGGASAVNLKTGQPVFSLDFEVNSPTSNKSRYKPLVSPFEHKSKAKGKASKSTDSLLDMDDLRVRCLKGLLSVCLSVCLLYYSLKSHTHQVVSVTQ